MEQHKYKGTDEEDLLEDQEVDNQQGYDHPEQLLDYEPGGPQQPQHHEVKRRRSQHYRDPDVERGEAATVIQEEHEVELSLQRPRPQPPMKMASTSGRNYHDRYSYAGYEPERDFKDYTRDRELMLQRQPRNNSYTARYIFFLTMKLVKLDKIPSF